MKILHVVNDANTGGAQTLIENLALSQPGNEVHVFVLMGKGSLSDRLERAAGSVTYGCISRRSLNPFRLIATLRRLVISLEIDILHSHLLQSDLVCLLARLKTPHVSTVHTSGAHESNRVSRFVSRMVALMSSGFDGIVACSPSAAAWARKMRYRGSADIRVIYNGSKVPAHFEPSFRQDSFVCLSRWHPMKDHATLLHAFEILIRTRPNWRLVCAGQGMDSSNEELVAMIDARNLGPFVFLEGPVQDVQSLLRESRALVISSSHGEALPMAGIEALANGSPVVTTDVGDCASLTVSADFLVAPRSPSELAAALERVASIGEPAYKDLQTSSWRLAQRSFDAVKTAEAYEHFYETVSI